MGEIGEVEGLLISVAIKEYEFSSGWIVRLLSGCRNFYRSDRYEYIHSQFLLKIVLSHHIQSQLPFRIRHPISGTRESNHVFGEERGEFGDDIVVASRSGREC